LISVAVREELHTAASRRLDVGLTERATQERNRAALAQALAQHLICGSVQWCSAAAARANPLSDRLRVRTLLARTGLLARPAGAHAHRSVPAWALLRLELGLLLRVQVADILGKEPVRTCG
jgi:hypothetical protein